MAIGGGIGQAERDYGLSSWDYVAGFDYYRPLPYTQPLVNVPMGDIYRTIAAGISAQEGVAVPEIFPDVQYSDSGVSAPAPIGDTAVLPQVIDPEADTEVTVFEEEVASRGPVSPARTDWDEFYDRYVVLNPEQSGLPLPPVIVPPRVGIPIPGPVAEVQIEEEPVSVWTDVMEGVGRAIFPLPAAAMDLYQGYGGPGIVAGPPAVAGPPSNVVNIGGGMQNAQAATCPPVGPKYAKICLATNTIMPLRQRRRRRLLTSSDLSDLAALKALFGNSAGVQAALVKAVRR